MLYYTNKPLFKTWYQRSRMAWTLYEEQGSCSVAEVHWAVLFFAKKGKSQLPSLPRYCMKTTFTRFTPYIPGWIGDEPMSMYDRIINLVSGLALLPIG